MYQSPKLSMDRRALLRSLGFGASSLALPSLISDRKALAAGPPKRVIFLMTMFGTTHREYGINPGAQPRDRKWETDITGMNPGDFKRVLRPLHPLRRKMLALEGLDMVTAKAELKYYVDVFHSAGTINLVTGNHSQAAEGGIRNGSGGRGRTLAKSVSMDQVIADRVKMPGQIGSLEIATGKQLNGNGTYSYRGRGTGLPPEREPCRLFSRLFDGFTPPETDAPEPPKGPSLEARIRAGRKSVLDHSRERFDSFMNSGQLSAEDKRKLEDHRGFIREIEQQIPALEQEPGGAFLAGCAKPDKPGCSTDYSSGPAYDRHVDSMMKMVAAGLACDRTRVVNMVLHTMPSSLFSPDRFSNDVHFGWAHQTRATSNDPWGTPREPDIYEIMTKYHTYHAEHHVKKLAELLDSIPEGNGTLLDNTLLLWWNEMGHGYHRADPYPAVILGGGNMGIDTGKFMYLPARPHKLPKDNEVRPSTNQLLVSVAHAMGLDDINSIGMKSVEGVDLTGPLEGIKRG